MKNYIFLIAFIILTGCARWERWSRDRTPKENFKEIAKSVMGGITEEVAKATGGRTNMKRL